MSKTPSSIFLTEAKYWHIDRRTQRIVPWVARKLPKKVKYFVVIHGMVSVADGENPSSVTGMELLHLWEE